MSDTPIVVLATEVEIDVVIPGNDEEIDVEFLNMVGPQGPPGDPGPPGPPADIIVMDGGNF